MPSAARKIYAPEKNSKKNYALARAHIDGDIDGDVEWLI